MSTKVNKTAIGAFVLGAVALAVAAVLVLGAGKFFTTVHTYITYFEGSVKGLNIGSPVMFRGVKVGEVTSISIMFDKATNKLKIPVVFNLEPEKFKGTKEEFQRDPKTIEKAVKELGLRTQLQSMSFVTGQLMVALDFFPDKPAILPGSARSIMRSRAFRRRSNSCRKHLRTSRSGRSS
jgi:paraquat-inducible protein B